MNNTEIELKYKLDKKQKAYILADIIKKFKGSYMREKTMRAVYMDTLDNDLINRKIAFRIREEDENVFATIKTQGVSHDGLSHRKEWNVDISNIPIGTSIIDAFSHTEIKDEIKSIVGRKVLLEKIITCFIRKTSEIKIDGSILEIAFDEGEIITKEGQEDICELEVELIEGSEDCLINFGQMLVNKYQLEPEPASKYARGIRLLTLP